MQFTAWLDPGTTPDAAGMSVRPAWNRTTSEKHPRNYSRSLGYPRTVYSRHRLDGFPVS